MEDLYRATAKMASGEQFDVEGTICECANWAENVIRANDGEIAVTITKISHDQK